MNDSQQVINDQALPIGYECQGNTIKQYLGADDFSISYLAESRGVDVVLMEYFPHSMVIRGENTTDVLLKDEANQSEYVHGLATCRDDLEDLEDFHHPCVLDTQGFFEANNTIYRVSDALDNEEWISLEHCIKDRTLSEDNIMSLCTSLLDATEAIHAIGHIHSDLTPARILIDKCSHKLMMTGFGDMKYLFRPTSQSISRHVSPGYSPCENYYANESQGVWTDIYALGGILYRLLTGDTPVSSASRLSSLADHQHDPLVLTSRYFENVGTYSDQLLSAVDHALALQKQDRPQSIADWRKELGLVVTKTSEEKVNPPSLMIEGISDVPLDLPIQSQADDLDFSSFVYQAPQEVLATHRAYVPVAILGGLITAVLIGMFVYFSSDEPEFAINETYVSEVIVDKEGGVEKQLYSETDYQLILDVPLVDRGQEEYVGIRLPFSEYLTSTTPDIEFNSVDGLASLSSVKNLIDNIEIIPSSIVVTSEKSSQQTVSNKKTPHAVKAVSRTTNVKHHPAKTREQYQREWLAKQQQMKKRVEWQNRKALLKKNKSLESAAQIESQLLAESDW